MEVNTYITYNLVLHTVRILQQIQAPKAILVFVGTQKPKVHPPRYMENHFLKAQAKNCPTLPEK